MSGRRGASPPDASPPAPAAAPGFADLRGDEPPSDARLPLDDNAAGAVARPRGDRGACALGAPALTKVPPESELSELESHAEEASALLRLMANKWRLLVLCHLVHGEKSVGELQRTLGLSQSALSQHLAALRCMKLVETRRSAQTIYYRLAGREATAVLATLHDLYCAPAGQAREVDAERV